MQKTTPEFDAKYKGLNAEQKRAVDAVEGPVMVIAGPGTGKTQILTLRIANILKVTDTAPENILALTFTESAAYGMRKRLSEIIGSRAYKVNFHTFHSFANSIIKSYPEYFPRIVGSASATAIDQIRIMEAVLESLDLELLKPYGEPLFYLRSALDEIRNLKKDDITPEDFKKLVKDSEKRFDEIPDLFHEKGTHKGKMKGVHIEAKRNLEKNKELAKIYFAYEEKLKEEKLYDFEDMIMETVRVLQKEKDLLLRLQEEYQYVLADEHQDANFAQNKILELLSNFHDNPNLFIVGDEKQAIFRFQGASLENFLYFKKLYPKALLISLIKNYRSHQTILDSSHSLISKNKIADEKLRVKLESGKKIKSEKIKVLEFNSENLEHKYIAQEIKKIIKKETKPEEIAILFRNNSDALPIAETLARAGVLHIVESGEHILDDFRIANLVNLLKAVNDPTQNFLVGEAIFFDIFDIPALEAYKILKLSKKNKSLIIDEAPKVFKENILRWAKTAHNVNAVKIIETIVTESGFVKKLLQEKDSGEILRKLSIFISEAKKLAGVRRTLKLSEFLAHLDTLQEHNVKIEIENSGSAGKVRLMTVHKSKGLEFENVFITGAYDGHFGNKRNVKHFKLPKTSEEVMDFEEIDDERRLFYVALTRAKNSVYVTYSRQDAEGKERSASQFIEEIDSEYVEKIDIENNQEKFGEISKISENNFAPTSNNKSDIHDKKYLQEIFLEQGLSVTAINNYLKCPWEYFFKNLVRLPEEETKHALYGTAVHETLKIFFDKYRDEDDLNKKQLLEIFDGYINQKSLSVEDLKESKKKGEKALGGYFEKYNKTWPRNLVTEFSVAGITYSGLPEKVFLRGNIDKLDWNDDGSVSVTDYKTSKPKSRNELEGKTQNADGNYKRQLVFYKILLESLDKDKYKMRDGTIDFVEPDTKGNYKKELFVISDEEVQEIKNLVARVANEILDLTFWNKKCDDAKCSFCALAKSITAPR